MKTAAAGCTNAVYVIWWMGLVIMKWYRRIYPRREENYSRSLSPSPSSSSSSFSYMLRCMASSSFQKDFRVGVDEWRKRDTHTLYTATSCKFSYGFIFGMRKVMMTTTRKATKRKRKLCGTETLSCRHFSSSIITKPHIHTLRTNILNATPFSSQSCSTAFTQAFLLVVVAARQCLCLGDWKDYLKWKRETEEGMLMCAGSKTNAFFTFRQRHTTTMPLLSLLLLSSCKAIRKEEDDNDDHHFHLGYVLQSIVWMHIMWRVWRWFRAKTSVICHLGLYCSHRSWGSEGNGDIFYKGC